LERRCIPSVSGDHDLSKLLQKVLFLTVPRCPNLDRLKAVYASFGSWKLLLPPTCVVQKLSTRTQALLDSRGSEFLIWGTICVRVLARVPELQWKELVVQRSIARGKVHCT